MRFNYPCVGGFAATFCSLVLSSLSAQSDGSGRPATSKQDTPKKIPADGKNETHAPTGIRYSILAPGTGSVRPGAGDEAEVRYWEWLTDGTLIHSTAQSGPIRILVGDRRVPAGLSLGASLLTAGGRAKLTVPAKHAYGPNGKSGEVPPNATIVYLVELVNVRGRPKPATFIPGDPKQTKVLPNGVKYQILEPGSGKNATANDVVETEFTVWSLTGEVLFGSYQIGRTMRAPVNLHSHPFLIDVIPRMKKGSVWRLVVPASGTVEQLATESVWNLKILDIQTPPTMPKSDDSKSTTTRNGLYYERLAEGKGDRPRPGFACELEFDFWKTDGSFVAGSWVEKSNMQLVLGQKEYHRFLDEIVQLMQVGEVMRVTVPARETAPRKLQFDTVWRLKLLKCKAPLPIPEFVMPKADELTTTKSGLKYKVLSRGDGKGSFPRPDQGVVVHYCGWLADGTKFDSSYEKAVPAQLRIHQVIPGWAEGLQYMRPGDTYLFVIPSQLGFGPKGTPDGRIPPNADLVFHVKLLAVQ